MVSKPRFSILMPTHSRVDVVGLAIQSVLDQTVEDFELLVVGDGAAPGTKDVVDAFRDPRIRFFDLPKAPSYGYGNRNIALREARGEFIGFAADDDLLFPDHFEILAEGLKSGAAMAYSQALWVSTDGVAAPFLTNLELADEFKLFMEVGNSIPASCFLYHADSLPLRDAWPEDEVAAADWRLWQRIIRENPQNPFRYCRVPTVMHFSARWKNSRNSLSPQLATILDIADKAGWWPPALRVSVPKDSSEQREYSRLMRSEPTAWSRRTRHAVGDLVAKLAWEDVNATRPALAKAEAERAALQLELSALGNKVGQAHHSIIELQKALSDTKQEKDEIERTLQDRQADILALHQSNSWRATAPLRWISTALRSRKPRNK
jgi:glycosyltransferase involved in cell wall biosynthesis